MVDDVIRHEFGHLIVAKSLGFQTGKVELLAKNAGAEITLDIPLPTIADVASYIERRIKVLYGGAIAECLRKNNKIDGPSTVAKFNSTAADDFSKIREIMRISVGIRHPQSSKQEFPGYLENAEETLSNEAADIVLQEAELIREMTDFFLDKRRKASPIGKPPLQQFILTARDIDSHPSIVARFAPLNTAT
jgi:hypothetical protein